MVIIFEQDFRIDENGNKGFIFKPTLFKGLWKRKLTWRIVFGIWSISYYPEIGLKEFFEHIEQNNTQWYKKSTI
jgi:hypothetical protein